MVPINFDSVFGPMDDRLTSLVQRARAHAASSNMSLDGAHVVLCALDELPGGPLGAGLTMEQGTQVRPLLLRLVDNTARDHDHIDIGGITSTLKSCIETARERAEGLPLSSGDLIWSLFRHDPLLARFLHGCTDLGLFDESRLLRTLQDQVERRTNPSLRHSTGNGSMEEVLAVLAAKLTETITATTTNTFATAHDLDVGDLLNALSRGTTYQRYDLLVLKCVRGVWAERLAKSLAETLERGNTLLRAYQRVVQIDLRDVCGFADTYTMDIAKEALSRALAEVQSSQTTLVVFEHLESFDRSSESAQQLGALLTGLHQLPAVALYWQRRDNEPIPAHSVLNMTVSERVEPATPADTRETILRAFISYWEKEFPCQIASDAFEDIYPLAPWLYFGEHDPIALPYSAIFIGTNTCKTLQQMRESTTSGQLAVGDWPRVIERRVNRAQKHLERAISGMVPTYRQKLEPVFAGVRGVLQQALSTPFPHDNRIPITRSLVTTELLASELYKLRLDQQPLWPLGTGWPNYQSPTQLAYEADGQIAPPPAGGRRGLGRSSQ